MFGEVLQGLGPSSDFQKRIREIEFEEKIIGLRCIVLLGRETLLLPVAFIVKI